MFQFPNSFLGEYCAVRLLFDVCCFRRRGSRVCPQISTRNHFFNPRNRPYLLWEDWLLVFGGRTVGIALLSHFAFTMAVLALVLGLVSPPPPLTIVLSISHRHSAFRLAAEAFNFSGSLLSKSSTNSWTGFEWQLWWKISMKESEKVSLIEFATTGIVNKVS